MSLLRTAVAQLRNVVGDIEGNAARVAEAMQWAEAEGADVLVLPELVLTGYPVADLVLHREFVAEAEEAVAALAEDSGDTVTVLSTVTRVPPRRSWDSIDRSVSISAAVLAGGEHRGTYHKVLLPTHGAYDEGKNIAPGDDPGALWRIGDATAGICICEDLWSGDGPPEAQSAGGAQVLLAPNASPYHRGKHQGREHLATTVARRNGIPLVYANLVGGQDELVFDGGSLVVGADGDILYRAASFAEEQVVIDVPLARPRRVTGPVRTVHTRPLPDRSAVPAPTPATMPDDLTQVWDALVTGTRDFGAKNGFARAVLGLSGGIDAAVTAAVASDAFGPDAVLGVAMPTPDSPADDLADAEKVAAGLGISYAVVPLEQTTTVLEGALTHVMADRLGGRAAGNLAARARAAVLSSISDEHGHLVLATPNKTELSIGDVALHGDMVGGFSPLRDCPKTLLYQLAEHRNARGPAIPTRVLEKETTAQRDHADLPPYGVLDRIVERYIEYGEGVEDLIAEDLDADTVLDILRRIDRAEYKRRLTPPGVKITPRAFGTDRQMPISNAWRAYRRDDTNASDPRRPRLRLEPEAEGVPVDGPPSDPDRPAAHEASA